MEMIRRIVLLWRKFPQIKVQPVRMYALDFTGNVCEQSELVYLSRIGLKIPIFFSYYCCHNDFCIQLE